MTYFPGTKELLTKLRKGGLDAKVSLDGVEREYECHTPTEYYTLIEVWQDNPILFDKPTFVEVKNKTEARLKKFLERPRENKPFDVRCKKLSDIGESYDNLIQLYNQYASIIAHLKGIVNQVQSIDEGFAIDRKCEIIRSSTVNIEEESFYGSDNIYSAYKYDIAAHGMFFGTPMMSKKKPVGKITKYFKRESYCKKYLPFESPSYKSKTIDINHDTIIQITANGFAPHGKGRSMINNTFSEDNLNDLMKEYVRKELFKWKHKMASGNN